jgi:hypothetical protein
LFTTSYLLLAVVVARQPVDPCNDTSNGRHRMNEPKANATSEAPQISRLAQHCYATQRLILWLAEAASLIEPLKE